VGGVLVVWTSLAFGGLNVGYAWHDFYLGGARVLFPFLMGVLLARWLRGHAVRLPWAHVMFVPLILVLGAPAVLGGWYDVAAVLLVFPVILACAAQAGPQARLDPVWRWLGGVSYPVYVLHYPFVVTLSNLTKAHHLGGVAQVGVGMFTLVLVLGVSSLASRFYDIPVRRWLARRLSARAGGRDG
jgi:peptidoglycan/LPS O-acetylase OafA/YrhL